MGRRRRTARRSGRASGRRLYHPPGGRGMHTRYGFAMTAVLLTLSAGSATVKTREIEYRQGDTVLQGFIAWDDAARGKRPRLAEHHAGVRPNPHPGALSPPRLPTNPEKPTTTRLN